MPPPWPLRSRDEGRHHRQRLTSTAGRIRRSGPRGAPITIASSPVSRILSRGDPRGWPSLWDRHRWSASCNPPGTWRTGRPVPAWSCSGRGLPGHPGRPGCRWALTPPFHPCLCACAPSAVCSLLRFPSAHAAWELPSVLPCGVRTFLDRFRPRPPGELTEKSTGPPCGGPPSRPVLRAPTRPR